ncbi:tyrosine-type recombinase/integrase [Parageobacillus thermoglucosidasius]|uniref:Site-specific integrase n=1 Tax=Symbiobacterium thermophilum TaxID=2734 RepID=A0A953I9A0_SYMTR|nr:tyrosine-type recombinase/integrase [Symbiobacterium thermophilum]MED4905212.1 tyrosine-type recombinase/integrase [Parageobacillus thermoglucosidasius]MBY6276793.1 site-specific integrase [Symbiobacterium thermophilum]MED4916007.1 tyrosine-type recombinase/integrase [Parageobacillus thermoglucosidasius]MED4947109.1 tyrosine-type recombinase/integrase [Parageobacillus thermoglucosidasius]MED4981508.1 tyrosine-type recombinase/integrase [Parageobacillus thermoglucosidasius]
MASIQRRGKSSFLLVVEAGYDAKGKRLRRTKTIRIEDEALLKTTKKLRDYLNEELLKFKVEVEAGEYIAPEKMKLADFIKEWETKYAVKELSETTLNNYLSHIKNHILPALGHMRIDQIKPVHIVNFLDQIKRADGKKKPLSTRTIENAYLTIRNILQRAVEWQIIKSNPASAVKKPKSKKEAVKEVQVYDEKEVEALFRAVQNEPFHWRIFTTLAIAAGLRRGELLGLEWSNVDLENGVIRINKAIVKGRKGSVEKSPKTKKSNRLVSLPNSVIAELKLYRRHWLKQKLQAGDLWKEEKEYLFCNIDGRHFYPTTPTTWWRRFTKRAGIRYIRLHDLRHTSATLLINQGVHAKIIAERLGHSDIRVTMDIYGHALQKADHEAANKLDHLFTNTSSQMK